MAKVCSFPAGSPPSLPACAQAKGTFAPVLLLGIRIARAVTIRLGTPALAHATAAGTDSPAKDGSFTGRLRSVVLCLDASNFKSLAMNSCRAT